MPKTSTRMPFGKYQGRMIDALPKSYTEWFLETVTGHPKLREEILAMVARRGDVISTGVVTEAERRQSADYNGPERTYDCSSQFNHGVHWPDRQEWDGETLPWLDQSNELDSEFRNIVG